MDPVYRLLQRMVDNFKQSPVSSNCSPDDRAALYIQVYNTQTEEILTGEVV